MGHVLMLWPTVPQWLQIRRPSDLGFCSRLLRRKAPSGLAVGQVLELCPFCPQDEHARVYRFLSLITRLFADSGFI